MARYVLIAAMPDETYLKLFNEYLRMGGLTSQWSVECFTSAERLNRRFLAGDADAAVIHPPWLEQLEKSGCLNARIICAWSEDPSADRIRGFPALFKYQSVPMILSRLKSLMREHHASGGDGEDFAGQGDNCRMIAVYSAAGGAGKTTLSVQLLELLASRQHPVLYVGLESTSSLEAFVRIGEGMDMSRLLYEMENRGESFAETLRQAICRDAVRGFHYVRPFQLAEDAAGMTAGDTLALLGHVRSLGLFDCVVLDLESSVDERVKGAFLAADEIWWLLADETVCLMKTARRQEEWKRALADQWKPVSRRIRYLVNRSTDLSVSPECRRISRSAAVHLPEVPEWNKGSDAAPVAAGYSYREQLLLMYGSGREERRAGHG